VSKKQVNLQTKRIIDTTALVLLFGPPRSTDSSVHKCITLWSSSVRRLNRNVYAEGFPAGL